MKLKKRFQYNCKQCGALTSTTNEIILKRAICAGCRLETMKEVE